MPAQFALDDDSVVVIIGSGAGGGTMSRELTARGIKVVCLEAGKRLEITDIVNDPPAMAAKMSWLDYRVGEGIAVDGQPSFTCKTVGGTTTHWTANCPRFHDFEFKSLSTYGPVDGANLADWPVDLAEMAPYYERAENRLGVTGTNGIPRLPESNNFKVMKAGALKIGYTDVDTYNMAINSEPRDNRPACIQMGFCSSGCAINAKWTTLFNDIPAAEDTDFFDLRSECMAVEIVSDGEKVTGVKYVDADGTVHEQKARIVCVAGNVVETARILLNSKTERFPNGLANGSDQVGRNYMRHVMTMIFGLMPGEVNFYKGTQTAGVIRDEVKHDPSRGFVAGFQYHTLSFGPANIAGTISSYLGGWGKEYAGFMEQYRNLAGVIVTGEDMPLESNRITLHPTMKDKLGLPVPVVHYDNHPNNVAMIRYSQQQAKKLYEALGATHTFTAERFGATHNMGVARMGDDPKTSVTNRWGQTHEIKNLFVSDGSLFPTSASANPTLTIISLMMRQAEYLAGQMQAGAI